MSPQVFYRKWRSRNFAEVVGQEPVTQTLRNALTSGRISHAYLFCGPRGTGKTSTARILAKAVNCLSEAKGEPCNTCEMCQAITEGRALDVIEIDAASNTGVEDIRSLREKVNYSPNRARYKVYIVDEVHMLSNSASNALLKTLEEPPPHVIFILATTEGHKLLPTILSRCQRYDFKRISQADVISRLEHICRSEGIRIDQEALRLVARSATGSMRDALNLLEQLTTYYGSEPALAQVQSMLGVTGDRRAKELARHIIMKDVSAGIATVNAVNNDGLDLKQFSRELVDYLRDLLLVKTGAQETADLSADELADLKALAAGAPVEQILRAVKLFGSLQPGFDSYPTLPLELAIVDCSLAPEAPAANEKPARPAPAQHQQAPAHAAATPKPLPGKEAAPAHAGAVPHKQTPAPPASVPPKQSPAPVSSAPIKPPPVRAPEPEPVAAASPLEAGSELERLRQNWKVIIRDAPQDVRKSVAMAILRSAPVKLVSFENDVVVLGFRHPVHKEQIEKSENQKIVDKVVSSFLGRPCRVSCVLEEDNHLLKAALGMGAQIIDAEEK